MSYHHRQAIAAPPRRHHRTTNLPSLGVQPFAPFPHAFSGTGIPIHIDISLATRGRTTLSFNLAAMHRERSFSLPEKSFFLQHKLSSCSSSWFACFLAFQTRRSRSSGPQQEEKEEGRQDQEDKEDEEEQGIEEEQ